MSTNLAMSPPYNPVLATDDQLAVNCIVVSLSIVCWADVKLTKNTTGQFEYASMANNCKCLPN